MTVNKNTSIDSLTSLRFIFAIMIFLHHFVVDGKALFPNGFVGVTFFFILSGFVIALNYEEKIIHQKISYFNFATKRFIRLYPLHILCFLASLIIAISFLNWKSIMVAVPNLLLLQSWIPLQSVYFSFNAVSWCLSDQLFFYLMFPFLIILFNRIGKKNAFNLFFIIASVYFLSTFIVPDKWFHWIYYINPASRILDFILGIFLCGLYKWLMGKKINIQLSQLKVSLIELTAILFTVFAIVFANNVPDVYLFGMYYWIPMSLLVITFAYFNKWGGVFIYINK